MAETVHRVLIRIFGGIWPFCERYREQVRKCEVSEDCITLADQVITANDSMIRTDTSSELRDLHKRLARRLDSSSLFTYRGMRILDTTVNDGNEGALSEIPFLVHFTHAGHFVQAPTRFRGISGIGGRFCIG